MTTCLSAAPGQTRTQGHPLLPLWGHWKRPNSSPGTGVRRGLAVGRDFWERRVAVGPFCISAVVVTQLHASGPTQDRATRREALTEALTDGDDAPNLTSTTPATAGPGPLLLPTGQHLLLTLQMEPKPCPGPLSPAWAGPALLVFPPRRPSHTDFLVLRDPAHSVPRPRCSSFCPAPCPPTPTPSFSSFRPPSPPPARGSTQGAAHSLLPPAQAAVVFSQLCAWLSTRGSVILASPMPNPWYKPVTQQVPNKCY